MRDLLDLFWRLYEPTEYLPDWEGVADRRRVLLSLDVPEVLAEAAEKQRAVVVEALSALWGSVRDGALIYTPECRWPLPERKGLSEEGRALYDAYCREAAFLCELKGWEDLCAR